MPDVILPDPPAGSERISSWSRRKHYGARGYIFCAVEGLTDRVVGRWDGVTGTLVHEGQRAIGKWEPVEVLHVGPTYATVRTDAGKILTARAEGFALSQPGTEEPPPETPPMLPGLADFSRRRKRETGAER